MAWIFVSSRKLVPLVVFIGITLFFLFQPVFIDEQYRLSPWSKFNGIKIYGPQRHGTLGVAAMIYVLSLPSRADRRKEMERLRMALGLRWTYMDATNTKAEVITTIMDSVRAIRAKNSSASPFSWPNDHPSSKQWIDPWSPGFLSSPAGPPVDLSTQPIVCAAKNFSVVPYDVDLPEFLILTPARVACWYSHLSVIEKIANNNDLNDDDVAIVLEDDIDMERDIHERLKYLWSFLPTEWDIVFLGHCWSDESFYPALNIPHNSSAVNGTISKSNIHPSHGPSCTHAYALSRAGARRLLLDLRYPPFAYSRSIDVAIAWLVQIRRLKSFSIVPSIVVQRKVGNSDIISGKGSGWKDDLFDGMLQNLGELHK